MLSAAFAFLLREAHIHFFLASHLFSIESDEKKETTGVYERSFVLCLLHYN